MKSIIYDVVFFRQIFRIEDGTDPSRERLCDSFLKIAGDALTCLELCRLSIDKGEYKAAVVLYSSLDRHFKDLKMIAKQLFP